MTLSCLSVNLPIALEVQAGQRPLSFLDDPIVFTNDYRIYHMSSTQGVGAYKVAICCLSQLACLPYMLQHCSINAQSKPTTWQYNNYILLWFT